MGLRRFLWNVKMKVLSMMSKDAKVIYSSIRELEIPKEQLYLHDDEECPCGSGKKYKECCKNKEDQNPIASKKPPEVILMERMRKGLQQDKVCLHPDKAHCRGKIKEAHALQNHKIISLLASADNHVIMQDPTRQPIILDSNPKHPFFAIPFVRVSGNKATTQTCFCDVHDTISFKAIEAGAPDFDPQNEEMKFVYAYKAFIFEFYKQQHLMWMMRKLFSEKPQLFSRPEHVAEYRVQSMRMTEFQKIKKHYDSEIMNGTHNGVGTFVVEIPHKIQFANYAYIAPEFDLNGNKISTIDKTNMMHRIAVTVLPESSKSYILMSCLDTEMEFYSSYFNEMSNAPLDRILFYFNIVLPLYSENLVLSEQLWNSQNEEMQAGLTYMANLIGNEQVGLSQTVGMALRNAARKRNFDYSKRVGFDLFK